MAVAGIGLALVLAGLRVRRMIRIKAMERDE